MEDTIPGRLFARAKAHPNDVAHQEKVSGQWVPTTYGQYGALVRRAGKALLALGLEPGGTVSILGYNRPEWVILAVAAMSAGGAPAGIYTTCSPGEVAYIAHHAGSPLVLVENEAQWRKVEEQLPNLPLVRRVVTMRGAPAIAHPMVLSWEAFLATGDGVADALLDARLAALEPQGLASLIYTSGTTGPPKGVMLSHRNLAWTATVCRDIIGGLSTDRALSYLPLSHIAEQMFTIHGPITQGSSVYFAESIEKVIDNLREVQPSMFFGVPRIWEKLHAGLARKLGEATGVKGALATLATRVGRRYHATTAGGEPAGLLLQGAQRLAGRLVHAKVKQAIGLGNARVCVSGAAPIAPEVLEFFTGLDILVHEVYGQSEDTGPTSFNLPGHTRLGTVGRPVPGVEVTLAEDGEILVRGPNVFLGYYKEPAATAEAIVDGRLRSGDLGRFDDQGYLLITGRKKEIIITAGGKNISPGNIEGALKNHPLVGEAVVIGDRRKYLVALVALDPEAAAAFARERSLSGEPAALPEVRAEVQRAVDEVNATLARVETVKRFTILGRPFTLDAGELTPTLKVKRRVVTEHFAREIEAMYEE